MIYKILKKYLFRKDPEEAHEYVMTHLKRFYRPICINLVRSLFPQHPVEVFGLRFPNPVGLAAGFDKNGDCMDALLGLGFGFIEVGAVTPLPQSGNPKPRLYRLPDAEALINRMGFNNLGVDYLVKRLKQRRVKGIVGVNLGKNQGTPLEKALDDFRVCYQKVYRYADYVTVNISSPNTPGLHDLQSELYLHDLLTGLKREQVFLRRQYHKHVPLLIKISPDLKNEHIHEIAELIQHHEIEGVVAVNTTRHRHDVEGLTHAGEEGGLSGSPLLPSTVRTVEALYSVLDDGTPIIAVGGILKAEDAELLINKGAKLVQVYTGLIYHGPRLIREIVLKLSKSKIQK